MCRKCEVMKKELLEKLEELLSAENPLEVQKEFNVVSAQLKSLLASSQPVSKEKKEPESAESEKPATDGATAEVQREKSQTDAPPPAAKTGSENHTPEAPSDPDAAHRSDEAAAPETEINPASAPPAEADETPVAEAEAGAKLPKPESPETASEPAPAGDLTSETPPKADGDAVQPESAAPKAEVSSEAPAETGAISDTPSGEDQPEPPVGESPESAPAEPDEARAKFKELTAAFKAKVSSARDALKRLEEETVATAKDLLIELQNLVENEENIGKAFAGFNAVQEKWKSLPKVSNDNYRDLNVEYNKLIERFFYNINIYKELKELDLKRNLEEKQKVLETQKNLLEVNDIRLLEVEVRMNQDRWNEIGPTFKEEWDKIKDEFWEVTRTIYRKIQDFYNLRKEEQERNLEAKKELLEAVKQIEALELKAHKKWQEKTKEVIELQKKWKLVGFVPKDKAKTVWKAFRETCDSFFEKKRAHYAEIRKEQDANRDAKEALLIEAEELKDSTDWKDASNRLINLQKKWKEIGAAHQRDENKLWKKFRAACDHFFQARNAQKAENTEQEKDNLKAKEELLEKLEAFAPDPSDKGAIDDLKAFSEEWRKIGHVPFKQKDKVNKAYKQLMDEKFAILKVDKREKEKMRFEEKIDLLKSSDAKDKLVRKEQDFIRSKISKIESEINQYENNLGFFANSKGAEKMKEEVMKKINKAKQDVDALYAQLEVLDEVE